MKKIPFVIMALALIVGLAPAGIVGANGNSDPLVIDLIAGQDEVVGTVTVQEDGGQICTTYALSESALAAGWLIYETHLYIGTTDSFPLPGEYPYGDEDLGGVPDWTFCLDLAALGAETGGRLYIATCAVIRTRAYTEVEETLYLSDGGEPGQEGIYSVELVGGVAELTLLYGLTGVDNFGFVTHLGATPDGETIYVISEDLGRLGAYSITGGTFNDLGPIFDYPGGVTQVAVSPAGELYMASKDTNRLYRVDVDTITATDVGDTGINVMGADIAFDADGVLYLYSNDPLLRNLYTVDVATGVATLVGHNGAAITGLAIRNGGRGDLVGSVNDDDTMIIIDKATGATVGDPYPMLLGGESFDHRWGDMTVGALSQPLYQEETACGSGDIFVKGTHHIVGGAAYPVNTLALLVPWLALLAVIAGTSLLMLRRRQTQS